MFTDNSTASHEGTRDTAVKNTPVVRSGKSVMSATYDEPHTTLYELEDTSRRTSPDYVGRILLCPLIFSYRISIKTNTWKEFKEV